MWLPETAVDTETLEAMVSEGIEFTILAPHQASAFRPLGGNGWIDVNGDSIDTRVPYLCRLPSGSSLSIFFYNNQIANACLFKKCEQWRRDGKYNHRPFQRVPLETSWFHLLLMVGTYGHHQSWEMALSY